MVKKVFFICLFCLNVVIVFSQVTEDIKQQIINVMINYAESSTVEQRLMYVRNPEKCKEIFATYYSDGINGYTPKKFGNCTFNNGWYTLEEYVEARRGNQPIDIIVNRFFVNIGNTYKLDWESSNGYNPISWKEFNALKNGQVAKMRCVAILYESKYNGYYGIRIRDYIGNSQFTAYLDKNSEYGKELFNLLKDGNPYAVILEMKYAEKDTLYNNNWYSKEVIIVNYVQRRWYIN